MHRSEWYHICNFCNIRKEVCTRLVHCDEGSLFCPDCEQILKVAKEKHISIADMVALLEAQRRRR